MKNLFCNTFTYAKFIFKREKKYFIIWFISIFFLVVGQAQSFVDLYPTAEDRAEIARSMDNPAIIALMGLPYGKDNYTMGALMSQQSLLFTIVAFAIMNIIFICRNTAADEEKGISDSLRAFPVGRQFQISASLIVSFIVNLVFSIAISIGLFLLKIDSIDLNGSITYGAVIGVAGIFFAAVAAVFAQISPSNATGLTFGVLGLSYFIRAIGDIGSEVIAYISPLGALMRSQVYVKNNFIPVMVIVIMSLIFSGIAIWLNTKRDYGSGVFVNKTKNKTSSDFLRSPFTLALRLLFASSITWIAGFVIMGFSFGGMLDEIISQLEKNDMMKQIFITSNNTAILDQFISVMTSIVAIIGTIPCIIAVLKINSEETSGRMDIIMSHKVSRFSIIGSYFYIAIIISVVLQMLFAVSMWAGGRTVLKDPIEVTYFLKSALSYLPAIWMMIGLFTLMIGIFRKGIIIAWLYYGYSVFVIYFGSMLKLSEKASKLTSYGNIPNVNIDDCNYTGIICVFLISVILSIIGFVGYKKSDITN